MSIEYLIGLIIGLFVWCFTLEVRIKLLTGKMARLQEVNDLLVKKASRP